MGPLGKCEGRIPLSLLLEFNVQFNVQFNVIPTIVSLSVSVNLLKFRFELVCVMVCIRAFFSVIVKIVSQFFSQYGGAHRNGILVSFAPGCGRFYHSNQDKMKNNLMNNGLKDEDKIEKIKKYIYFIKQKIMFINK